MKAESFSECIIFGMADGVIAAFEESERKAAYDEVKAEGKDDTT